MKKHHQDIVKNDISEIIKITADIIFSFAMT